MTCSSLSNQRITTLRLILGEQQQNKRHNRMLKCNDSGMNIQKQCTKKMRLEFDKYYNVHTIKVPVAYGIMIFL